MERACSSDAEIALTDAVPRYTLVLLANNALRRTSILQHVLSSLPPPQPWWSSCTLSRCGLGQAWHSHWCIHAYALSHSLHSWSLTAVSYCSRCHRRLLRRARSRAAAMNQQYDYPLPPPPPSPRSGGTSNRAGPVSGSIELLADAGFVSGNLPGPVSAVLPSITTTFLSPQGACSSQASTSVSGTRLSPGRFPYAPGTPGGLNPQIPGGLAPLQPPATPRSPSMEPYNPRQWSRGQVSGSQMVFQQRHSTMLASTAQLTGQEGMF